MRFEKGKIKNHSGIWKWELFGGWVFCLRLSNDSGWFRLFGVGLEWKHKSNGLTFSERNGYERYLEIGNWIIRYLKRN